MGLLQPDSGQIEWRGSPVTIRSPQHARDLGIGMVFQHFSLFQALTVAENIALALPPGESLADLAERVRRHVGRIRHRRRPACPHPQSVGRPAAARRDRPLPAAGPVAADHGRADIGAHAAGDRPAVRRAATVLGVRCRDSVHLAQARGNPCPDRACDRSSAGPQCRHGGDRRQKQPAACGDDGRRRRGRHRRAGAAVGFAGTFHGQVADRPAETAFATPLRDVSFAARRARCSASPASPATARTS